MLRKINKAIDSQESVKVWFWSLVLVIFLCFFSYGYFVQAAIVNIVSRQGMEDNLSALSSKVLDLESAYIKAKNNVTPELAKSLGYVPVSDQKFVLKNTNTQSLSLVTSGI